MERSHSLASKQQVEEGDFNLKEWGVRGRRISRENTKSRRFSASNFREEARSFRSNITISSTASSPGYTAVREEIDPSTYSFTTALKALQAKTVYRWEFQSAEGMSLNSKWSEAEKYICNPLSGEVPLECLSAKTLSKSGSFHSCRITMSAPLIYPSNMQHFHASPPPINQHEHEPEITSSSIINIEKKTRDVGTQSTAVDLRSSSPSPAPTPSIEDRSINIITPGHSSLSTPNFKSHTQVEVEERRDVERGSRKRSGERKKQQMMSRCSSSNRQGGCLSLRGLWMRTVTHRDKHKPRTTNNTNMHSTFLHHLNA